jgi:hypothetical protein
MYSLGCVSGQSQSNKKGERKIGKGAPENDRVAARPAQQDHIARVQAGGEELGLAKDVFQVVLFTAVLGNGRAELKVHSGAGCSDQHAGHPDEQRQPHAARKREDGAGRRKNASTDDAVDDQEGRGHDSNVPLGLSGLLELS